MSGFTGLACTQVVLAANDDQASAIDSCVIQTIRAAQADTSVGQIRRQCESQSLPDPQGLADEQNLADEPRSLLGERARRERHWQLGRSVLTPHKRNYLLPVSWVAAPNNRPFDNTRAIDPDSLENPEASFQISLKVPIVNNLLFSGDQLHIGFTTISFWQAYNSSISAPFRETNYEPEIFWSMPLGPAPLDVDATVFQLGLSHQSNGRSGTLSRSWNRVYANFVWERANFVFGLKPWWRIPEDPKSGPEDSQGDDNPDIERYLGHFEFTTVYRRDDHEFSVLMRHNLRAESKGAVQLDWTFPLWRGIRGYAQYFNGYGESLIDYDARIQRLGVGILLSDLL